MELILISFIKALASVGIVAIICYLLMIICNLIYFKIDCKNKFYKKELKDRNNIIAELLNLQNR